MGGSFFMNLQNPILWRWCRPLLNHLGLNADDGSHEPEISKRMKNKGRSILSNS
jgi:hypothetical protein